VLAADVPRCRLPAREYWRGGLAEVVLGIWAVPNWASPSTARKQAPKTRPSTKS